MSSSVRPRFGSSFLFLVLLVSVPICQVAIGQTPSIDVEKLKAVGLQVTQSSHLTLVTDVRGRADVSEFNEVFEQAVAQWCEYFSIPKQTVDSWHITCSLILDKSNKQKFVDAGLFPSTLPPFPAGYQVRSNIWVYLQEGDYYTRHLLIHEGTHAFMEKFLGGYGAPWYAEGMAELLGVHQWKDGKLTINYDIKHRDDVPYWGRVKLVRQEREAGARKSLDEVLAIEGVRFREVKTYGWAWAACEFFDSHPDFQQTFRKMAAVASLSEADFNQQFRTAMKEQWPKANQEWHWMVDEIEYGYNVAQSNLLEVTNRTSESKQTRFSLAADRGWQSTGIAVKAGDSLQVSSSGSFQVKHDGDPWPCDGGGVTLQHYNGRPLGRLLAAIETAGPSSLEFIDVGVSNRIEIPIDGMLLMRINESPANWNDNQGELKIAVEK